MRGRMSSAGVEAVARCLVALARLDDGEQLAAVVSVVKTWLGRDGGVAGTAERARLWRAACRAAGKAAAGTA